MRRFGPALLVLALVLGVESRASAVDKDPPVIHHTPVTGAASAGELKVSAEILDQSPVFGATLWYRYKGMDSYLSVELRPSENAPHQFEARIRMTDPVEYYLEAYDEFGNGPTRFGAPAEPFKIALLAAGAPTTFAEAAAAPAPVVEAPRPAEKPVVEAPPPVVVEKPAAVEPPPVVEKPAPPAVEEPPATVAETPTEPPPSLPPAAVATTTAPETPDYYGDGPTPIYKKWWFIGGAGVVVAAVAGVVVYSLQPANTSQNVFHTSFTHP